MQDKICIINIGYIYKGHKHIKLPTHSPFQLHSVVTGVFGRLSAEEAHIMPAELKRWRCSQIN